MFTETREIRIETSTRCNYRCAVCARGVLTRKTETMPADLFDDIVRRTRSELPRANRITLSGFGEFATDPDWRRKVAMSGSCFDAVHIVTNLSLLQEPDLEFLLRHVSDIRVSLYGISEATFHEMHRPSADVHCATIRDRVLWLMAHRSDSQRIILNYLECAENVHETAAWIAFWKDRVDLVEVWTPHNWIHAKTYRPLSARREPTCGRPAQGPVQVQVDGTVNVCCFDFNGEMIIGDLKTQSFAQIFNGAAMTRIQELHAAGRADELPLCRVCDQRNDCASSLGNLLYNSRFAAEDRVGATSTEYEKLNR